MVDAERIAGIRRKFQALSPVLDERSRRHWAAVEANELGWGGVTAVSAATGLSRTTINAGMKQLKNRSVTEDNNTSGRIRRSGGGRKPMTESDPQLMEALEKLVEPVTRGDPQSSLRWTLKSTQRLADELTDQQHPITARTVAKLLRVAGYSLQANRKMREGDQHPDRNAQFE